MASERLHVTFALPQGGTYRTRVAASAGGLMVSIYSRGSIARVIQRAVRNAARQGLKLGNCLRITRGSAGARHVLFDYQLDVGAGWSK